MPPSDVPVFLEQSRWLLDQQWRRGDAFERKAVALLGYEGLILALVLAGIASLRNAKKREHTAGLILGCGFVSLLLFSAACAIIALWARKGPSVNFDQTRSLWLERRAGQTSDDPDVAFTEWLLDADALAAHRKAVDEGSPKQAPVTSPVAALGVATRSLVDGGPA